MTTPANAAAAPKPAPGGAAHKRQLRNYLLNKRYQLQYTLVMVGVSAVIMFVLGYLVKHKQDVATDEVIMSAQATFDEEVVQEIRKSLIKEDKTTLLTLVGAGFGLAMFLTVFGIVMTHKVAGPLYKITLYFHKMKDGNFSKVYNLRKGDQLVEFYTEFKDMHDALRTRQATEAARIGDLLDQMEKAGLDKNPEVSEAYAAVKQLREQKEKSLGS